MHVLEMILSAVKFVAVVALFIFVTIVVLLCVAYLKDELKQFRKKLKDRKVMKEAENYDWEKFFDHVNKDKGFDNTGEIIRPARPAPKGGDDDLGLGKESK